MRLIHWIFALLVAVLALMVTLAIFGDPPGATGGSHPEFAGMNVGGDGLARLDGRGWLIALLQVLTLVLIHLLIAFGVNPRHRSGTFWALLAGACGASLFVWWRLYAGYLEFLRTGQTDWLWGFPAPTTYMLLGVFGAGSLLCALYIWGFRRFVLTPEDEAAYEALRAAAVTPRVPEPGAAGSERD